MPAGIFVVTGKLGSGKSLAAVGRIRERLQKGCPVATNLNIRLHKLIGPNAKKAVLYRIPDKPTLQDMEALGYGNTSYDDEKNGLIVLDECGTWFNSRGWQDKTRAPLIEWLLHARKLGWDIIFLIQNVKMLDKQARDSVAEYVVYCRRIDKALKIPLLESGYKFLTGREFVKPKAHIGIVKYGDQHNSLKVDTWWYLGRDLYPAYDTKQKFSDYYPHGLYQVLPPWYSHGRYAVKRDLRFFMRMTKIYFKRFSKVAVLSFGILGGAAIASVMQPKPEPVEPVVNTPASSESPDQSKPNTSVFDGLVADKEKPKTLAEKFDGFIVTGVAAGPDGNPLFVQIGNGESKYNLQTLRAQGHIVRMVNNCEVLIMNDTREQQVRLHTSYCPPHTQVAELPRMTPQERYQWKLEQIRAMERTRHNW